MKHPNLHPLLGYQLHPQPHLVSPWCRHGDLGDYVRRNPSLTRSEKLHLVRGLNVALPTTAFIIKYQIHQAGCGLNHLHSFIPPICHADIKPENVLINDLDQAALSDFGLAMLDFEGTSGFTTSETIKGTLAYMAAQLFSGEKPSRESDVFAFGGLILAVSLCAVFDWHSLKNQSLTEGHEQQTSAPWSLPCSYATSHNAKRAA